MNRKLLLSIVSALKRHACIAVVLQLICVSAVFAQSKVVTGKVTAAEDNTGLPGTSIVIKGSTVGTVSDADGNFSIEVPSTDAVLVFSSIGYASQEVTVGARTSIEVALTMDVTQLAEVVVVGYGTVKKTDVTGALSSVSEATIRERPITNVLQALQGKVAGMIVATNIRPGEIPSVRIRGNRSLNGGNDPLYVIDGIPMVNALGVNSFTLNDINPNDIASIEVLKDASATAIYGSRGANGVILVTTKKGVKGRVEVSYNASVALDSYKDLTDWFNSAEYVDRQRLAFINGRNYQSTTNTNYNNPPTVWYPDPVLDNSKMQLAPDPVAQANVLSAYEGADVLNGSITMRPTTAEEQAMGWPAEVPVYNPSNIKTYNWRDAATRTGVTQNHQIALNAGTETSRVNLSLSYMNQLGVQRDQDFKRYNVNLGGDITPNKWLTLGTSILGSFTLQNFGILPPNTSNTGAKDLYSRALEQFPFAQPRDANGFWIRNAGGNINLWNPLIDIDQVKNERRSAAIMANMFGEIKFAPWLKYRLNFGTSLRNFRNGQWTGPEATNHLTNRPNTAGYNTEQAFSWVAENLIYIDKSIGEDHKIGLTLLQSSQHSSRENIGANVTSTIYDISYWYDLASNVNGVPAGYGTGFTENTLMSYMGRVNYSLFDRYLLTASARYDGASVLAPGHKWDFFPSFALAWKMHEETFLSSQEWLNEFKPRFGYGVTGNSAVAPYSTSGPLTRNGYVFGPTAAFGFLPQLVKNPELGWEKTTQWNIGVDFSIFKGRVSGAVEVYEANTSDILMTKTLPAVSGYVQKVENIGKTRNRGVEITLNTTNIEKGDFSWESEINWFSNREEIVELMNGKEDMIGNGWFIGQPTDVYYQLDEAGIWQNTEADLAEMAQFNAPVANGGGGHRFYPGLVKPVDQNGDYRIDASDYVIRGTNRPKWSGGFTNTFRYKNWSLSSFIFARVGQTYFGTARVWRDVWGWDNPGGRFPMPTSASNIDNYVSAIQYNNGSYAIVRNISLSYRVPNGLLDRVSIKNLELNAQVLNPFLLGGDMVKLGVNPDDTTGWDNVSQANTPNAQPLGGMNNNTVLPQSIVFGLRASF